MELTLESSAMIYGVEYPSREAAADAAADGTLPDGTIGIVDGLQYQVAMGETVIADMPNWLPAGEFAQPEHFAAPTGTADATSAFQSALNWMAVDPARKLRDLQSGVRTFAGGLSTIGHVDWDAGSATYHITYTGGTWLSANNTSNAVVLDLEEDYVIGSSSIMVADAPEIQRGQWLRVVSDAVNPYDRSRVGNPNKYRVQEFAQSGLGSTATEIVLETPLRFATGMNETEDAEIPAYTTALNARVAIVDMSKRFRFTGGTIYYSEGQSDQGVNTIMIIGYCNPTVEETRIPREFNSAIRFVGTVNAMAREIVAGPLGEILPNDATPSGGYGVCDGGWYTTVQDCIFSRNRHAYTTLANSLGANTASVFSSGNAVGAIVSGCRSIKSQAGAFDTHHGAVDITFVNCTAEGGASSFSSRGVNVAAVNCTSRHAGYLYVSIESTGIAGIGEKYAPTLLVDGGSHDLVSTTAGGVVYARPGTLTLRDTQIRTPRWRAIRVEGGVLNIEGSVSVQASDLGGQYSITAPTSGNAMVGVEFSVATPFYGKSSPNINLRGSLTLDLRAFTDLSGVANIINCAAGSIFSHSGTLAIQTAAGTLAAYYGATNSTVRCIPGARLILDTTGTALTAGKFAGLLTICDSSGNLLAGNYLPGFTAGNIAPLDYRGVIPAATDLDSYNTREQMGAWLQSSTVEATLALHYPVEGLRGYLFVRGAGTSGSANIVQEFIGLSDTGTNQGREFIRTYYTSAAGWSPWSERLAVRGNGRLTIAALPEYANDAAAGAGGLVVGDVYRTATGELRVKV